MTYCKRKRGVIEWPSNWSLKTSFCLIIWKWNEKQCVLQYAIAHWRAYVKYLYRNQGCSILSYLSNLSYFTCWHKKWRILYIVIILYKIMLKHFSPSETFLTSSPHSCCSNIIYTSIFPYVFSFFIHPIGSAFCSFCSVPSLGSVRLLMDALSVML